MSQKPKFFAVLSIFPKMFASLSGYGITGRAITDGKAVLHVINPRDFTDDNYRRVDERVFGGGPGMVMLAEPLSKAISHAKALAKTHGCIRCPVVYLSPQGRVLSEGIVHECLEYDGLILLCGRYEGIDERVLVNFVDFELSIGDYVLTGGELPAMVLMDSLIRRLPDVMNDGQSALQDSFVDGLLDYPHYTKPVEFLGQSVPEVLLSGHHANIAKWRFWQQLERTKAKRPELYQAFIQSSQSLDKSKQKWLGQFLAGESFD